MLVATPARLPGFVENGRISFEEVKFFVLDEADRMLDMGFLPNIKRVGTHPTMNQEHETLMFSATFPSEIQTLARSFLNENYVFLSVGVVGGANKDVKQEVHQVSQSQKRGKLLEILQQFGRIARLHFC